MYESFYGFTEKPFALSPDPQFLYLAEPHRRALTMLEYSLANEAPFCLITGEVGSGKTTLIRHLLKKVEKTTTVGLISNTTLNFGRLLQWICMSFGLDYDNKDDAVLYGAFSRFLVDEHAKGRKVVLIVDEAQNLGKPRLEELRVLSNINADKHLLLQTILVGQPELRSLIRSPDLLQLAQRISADYHLGAMSGNETRNYIRHRVHVAGGRVNLFRQMAILQAYRASRGIPRLVNQYCEQALVYGYAEGRERIDGELMEQVIQERRRSGLIA